MINNVTITNERKKNPHCLGLYLIVESVIFSPFKWFRLLALLSLPK